jgi:glycosyltransferase involved in cell wall biosynthesis
MNILHVVAGLPPAGGGLTAAVMGFAREAARLGHDVTIATVADSDGDVAPATAGTADCGGADGLRIVRFAPSFPRRLHASWEMLRRLRPLVESADVVHVHSNWTFPVWCAGTTALATGRPLVMSPHGSLSPLQLAHSRWKKRAAGLFTRRLLCLADAIHATSPVERHWIERSLGCHPGIEVVPLGVDLPTAHAVAASGSRTRQVLALGRLHPSKGLDMLLDAWRLAVPQAAADDPWELVIAGPDEQGTRAGLERQARELALENVRFTGPLAGDQKARAWADADLFVLPSRSENFGLVVPEALAAGVPVVATTGTPWREIDGACGWWVEPNADSLSSALAAAMRLDDAGRQKIGARGRRLVEERYRWPAVGRKMVDLYERLRRPAASTD